MSLVKIPLMLSLGIVLGIVLSVVLGAAFTVLYRIEEDVILADREDITGSFTRWLASSIEFHLERMNYYHIEQTTRSLVTTSLGGLPIVAIRVYDRGGRLVNIGAKDMPSGTFYKTTKSGLFSGRTDSDALGSILISWSLLPTENRLALFRTNLVIILLVALVAGLTVMSVILHKSLNKPIQQLNLAAFRLSNHEWDVEFPVERPDEVGLLARALDHIRDSLKASLQETEALVEQRTAELNQTLQIQYSLNNQLIEKSLEIERQTEALVASERDAALGRLTATMAHELNTPIGNGVTGISLLQKKLEKLTGKLRDGEMKKSDLEGFLVETEVILRSLGGNLQKAAELTTSFKAVAVDQTSEMPRTFNVAEYLGEIAVTLLPRLKKAGHSLEIFCPSDIGMTGYPGMLATIITNLAVNSINHAWEPWEKNGRMEIQVREEGKNALLTFRDDGIGIESEDLEKIFLPYFTTKAGQGGSGLGLHIVRSLVWKMGGSIKVESWKNKGTTFIMEIPKEVDRERQR